MFIPINLRLTVWLRNTQETGWLGAPDRRLKARRNSHVTLLFSTEYQTVRLWTQDNFGSFCVREYLVKQISMEHEKDQSLMDRWSLSRLQRHASSCVLIQFAEVPSVFLFDWKVISAYSSNCHNFIYRIYILLHVIFYSKCTVRHFRFYT